MFCDINYANALIGADGRDDALKLAVRTKGTNSRNSSPYIFMNSTVLLTSIFCLFSLSSAFLFLVLKHVVAPLVFSIVTYIYSPFPSSVYSSHFGVFPDAVFSSSACNFFFFLFTFGETNIKMILLYSREEIPTKRHSDCSLCNVIRPSRVAGNLILMIRSVES